MRKSVIVFLLLLLSSQIAFAQVAVVKGIIEPSEISPGGNGVIKVTYAIPDDMHQTLQEDYFYLEPEEVDGIIFDKVIYPEGKKEHGIIIYYGLTTLELPFSVEESALAGNVVIKVYAGYQLCDETGMCFFPEEEELELSFTVVGEGTESISKVETENQDRTKTAFQHSFSYDEIKDELDAFVFSSIAAGYIKSDDFIEFVQEAKRNDTTQANKFAGMSVWLMILLIIVGGIALNLTPCVLPMMPITIAVLGAGTQAESKKKGFFIGGLYGIGMMLAYGTLGIIVVLTGSRFGEINSSPWFNIIIAIIFVLLALAMFDVFSIDFTRFQSGTVARKKAGKAKYITIFILGVIAAVLAGACVAPVLISVILYSVTLYTAGNVAGLLLPFLLGLGMALPWPFVGAGLSILPKPGKWMNWVKIIFGVIILIIALYYGYTAVHLFSSQSHTTEYISKHPAVESEESLHWNKSLVEGLKIAQKENKPVFIDFWATWCKNCLAMDATTFKDGAVQNVLKDFVLIKYQAEDLGISPTKEILDRFGILGLPSYVVLLPKEK